MTLTGGPRLERERGDDTSGTVIASIGGVSQRDGGNNNKSLTKTEHVSWSRHNCPDRGYKAAAKRPDRHQPITTQSYQ